MRVFANRNVLLALLVLAAAGASADAWKDWHNALAPKGEAGPELVLADQGKTPYTIIVPETASTQEKKGAEDLALWLGTMTKCSFPILSDGPAQAGPCISVGRTKAAAVLPATQQDLGDEGYAICVQGQSLFLLGGRTRGVVNAVYALLEEDLGCRWYAGSAKRIPETPLLKFRPVPRTYVPVLMIRDPFYQVAFDAEWSLRNRTNAPNAAVPEEWGGHVDYALFVHTFNTLVPPAEYFEKHPEYFMLDASGKRSPQQLCTTNPEVVRIATGSVVRILKEKPQSEIISVSKNDGGGSCVCPNCRALDDAEGTNAASLLFLVNKVAEAVEKEFPRVTVSTLAYLETVTPPKTVRPRANVGIRLCTDNCMWAHPFTPAEQSEPFRNALLGWSAIHNRIHIWDYCVNFSHYTAPMPNLDVIAANIRFFTAHSAKGIMEQGAYQSPGAERDLLRAWVIAKLMWDPARDVHELAQDFIWGYFGKAAPAIAAYNDLLENTGREHAADLKDPKDGIRYPMDSPFLTKEFVEKASALYDEAGRLAENEEVRLRVERDRLPILYVQLCRGKPFAGPQYPAILAQFETIAHRVGLAHIAEGPPDVEQRLAEWKNR